MSVSIFGQTTGYKIYAVNRKPIRLAEIVGIPVFSCQWLRKPLKPFRDLTSLQSFFLYLLYWVRQKKEIFFIASLLLVLARFSVFLLTWIVVLIFFIDIPQQVDSSCFFASDKSLFPMLSFRVLTFHRFEMQMEIFWDLQITSAILHSFCSYRLEQNALSVSTINDSISAES